MQKSCGTLNFIFGFRAFINTSETDSGDFRLEYLGKYEAICETVLARLSTYIYGLDWWKTYGRKSRDTVPLKSGKRLIITKIV
jgi:hypothetical protein